jgi:uroporphyrin-III C-methyltransferase
MANASCVFLVGAGPGDPELLTVKARNLLDKTDVVVYDRLVSDEILALIPPGVARISVGKQPRSHPVPQAEINALLVRLAQTGRTVVRLKGGDPFLFGRGGEEAAYLTAHGIRFETVPGITSASGCAARCGFPLTHRGLASGVRFITGHCRNDMDLDLDWRGLADPDTTLVVYMGMANMPEIAVRLIRHGLPADTPAAVICNGTRPDQREVFAALGEIARAAADAQFDGPILFVIGRVLRMHEVLARSAEPADAEPAEEEAFRG